MAPFFVSLMPRSQTFDTTTARQEFHSQWTHPGDVFSVLLILGPDVISRALAQLAGGALTPVAFSFGEFKATQSWVAYGISALVFAVGENKLMPSAPDCPSIVINGKNGYVRDNSSWILGRLVRDFESWMSQDARTKVENMIDEKWADDQRKAGESSQEKLTKSTQAGLCVSIYKQSTEREPGVPVQDWIYYIGFVVALIQLGISAIPCGLYGDWGILMITASGVSLAFLSGSIPQWKKEKWACRRNTNKTVILTTGNGSQHAIVIVDHGRGLDLEDLAAGPVNVNVSATMSTRIALTVLAVLWILLLITAAGKKENSWFLLAVGGIGMLDNVAVAGWQRKPSALGVHLDLIEVIGNKKVMRALLQTEESYPHVGASMRSTFFPGELWGEEKREWDRLADKAKNFDLEQKRLKMQKKEMQNEVSETRVICK